MKKLNIHWQRKSKVVADALVDDEFYEHVNKLTWYISDLRNPAPPKSVIRIGTKAKAILLNRLVFLLSQTPIEERATLVDNKVMLIAKLSELQRIKVLSENKFDCRLENLDGTLSERSILHEKIEATAKKLPTTALPRGFSDAPKELQEQFEKTLENVTTSEPQSFDPDLDILPPVPPTKSVLESLDEANSIGDDKGSAETVRDMVKREEGEKK